MLSPAVTTARTGARCWGEDVSAVLDPEPRGIFRVLGGPGTGKSSLLIDVATARIAAGAQPESVLLLTGSGRLGARARSSLTTELLAAHPVAPDRAVVRAPLVRSVHALAFAVLRLAAQRAGDPPPRLITGAEQDGIIRELLAGDIEDGALAWPPELRVALGTTGFATELRDLLARCAERGVDPAQLQRLGKLAGRPEWTAAGRFAQQYEQVMLLRAAVGMAAPQATVPALGAAELVGAALEAFATDPDLLAAEHARISTLLVDDAQHLDPQAARLVRLLAAGAETAVFAGDPNQTVFGFRGADPALLLADSPPSVTLRITQRCSPAIARAITGVLGQLPGAAPSREIASAGTEPGAVSALLAASEHAEAALVADTLRRAHLIDGVPWSQMAVIVRSVPRAAALPRALAGAGVPVAPSTTHGPLLDNATVRALLTVLDATATGLTGDHALTLLTGPIGRIDPVTLRQLRRALRRIDGAEPPREFGELLVGTLSNGIPNALSASHAKPLRRIAAVLTATAAAGADPRAALWQAWQRSGLARRLLTASERSGTGGLRAAADLDAVTALFDITDQFAARTAGASVSGLADHIAGLQLPAAASEPVETPEAVCVLSPHQALDRDWDVVVIAGLQEGLWPNTVPRGGILGTQRLLDVLAGITGDVSLTAPLVAEERRLLITAMGRARDRLVVTAVDGAADDSDEMVVPSPFFYDIARFATVDGRPAELPAPVVAPPVLSVAAVVGKLRSVVCAPTGAVDDTTRDCAAAQLAKLAAAGVPGADPSSWHSLVPVSTETRLWDDGPDAVVSLSPSTLQTLQDCPLRWLMERHGGADARELRSTLGSLVHALISQRGKSESQLMAELEALWQQLPFESDWFARNELTRHQLMLATFTEWREQTRAELTEVGTEVDVDGVVTTQGGEAEGPDVRLRGRVDRLERDAAGGLVIIDVKTGKSPVSKDDAQRHAQLAAYQLAVAEGLLPQGDQPGGGRLVYVAKTGANGATERTQDPLTPQALADWRGEVQRAAAATAGPQFVARRNDGCAHCPVRPACPAHTAPTSEEIQ
ncbi:ATP-dependent helicase [Mycolicibacterium komossense]|uniref:DNA 3'-5' helicase n=1 Tax=Mycolicibacterium komossense TaxID=1779 RepID=A0ABT3CC81_9MYCO|nr:ATP-dependent DNA helicase [Mycolicibacterium komossense]MCV7227078.1 ATP-dependent helicase [Mycolicibacterium komossense]